MKTVESHFELQGWHLQSISSGWRQAPAVEMPISSADAVCNASTGNLEGTLFEALAQCDLKGDVLLSDDIMRYDELEMMLDRACFTASSNMKSSSVEICCDSAQVILVKHGVDSYFFFSMTTDGFWRDMSQWLKRELHTANLGGSLVKAGVFECIGKKMPQKFKRLTA